MKEYHKIETLFERDMQRNKKLIEGKFRNKILNNMFDFRGLVPVLLIAGAVLGIIGFSILKFIASHVHIQII